MTVFGATVLAGALNVRHVRVVETGVRPAAELPYLALFTLEVRVRRRWVGAVGAFDEPREGAPDGLVNGAAVDRHGNVLCQVRGRIVDRTLIVDGCESGG